MIDHIYLPVSDLKRSSEFYKKVLEPLGIDMPYKLDQPPMRGFAINNIPGFWLKNGDVAKDLYVAFTAKSADAVRASYKAAIDAGATSNKEPSLRPEWRADYFAANIGDPDGYNIEIAYKPWLYTDPGNGATQRGQGAFATEFAKRTSHAVSIRGSHAGSFSAAALSRQLGVRVADDKELLAADVAFVATPAATS
jgi:predicted lactoylglutathione lyase